MKIKTIKNKDEVIKVFRFLSKLFYEEAKEYKEHYFTMSERYQEMVMQFKKDKELLLYVEENNKIIGALTSKGMNLDSKKITLGVMGVLKEYRRKGIAKLLINEFEKRCKEKGILHIDLGSRFRACPLYLSLGYKPSLMIQIFDFETIENVRKVNKYGLKEGTSWQGETYGFIFYEIPKVDEKYIQGFEKHLSTVHAQFIFEKDL